MKKLSIILVALVALFLSSCEPVMADGFKGGGIQGTNIISLSTNVVYVDPNGNDANDGLSHLTPKKTFVGINTAPANRHGNATIIFNPGVYQLGSATLYLTNNTVLAYGATLVSTSGVQMVQFEAGTNVIYGGTWSNRNAGNGVFYVDSSATGPMSLSVYDAQLYGNYDVIYMFNPSSRINVITARDYLDSTDYDTTQIDGDGTNSIWRCIGCTMVSSNGGSGFARTFAGSGLTCYFTGNTSIVKGSSGEIANMDMGSCNIFLEGNSLFQYSSIGVCITNTEGTGPNNYFIQGHPYDDAKVGLIAGDTLKYSGWWSTMTANTTTNVTFNASGAIETQYNTSSSTIASLSITLPSTTTVGQICRYDTAGAATLVTVHGTVSVGAALTSLSANATVAWQAVNATGTFVRIQ